MAADPGGVPGGHGAPVPVLQCAAPHAGRALLLRRGANRCDGSVLHIERLPGNHSHDVRPQVSAIQGFPPTVITNAFWLLTMAGCTDIVRAYELRLVSPLNNGLPN